MIMLGRIAQRAPKGTMGSGGLHPDLGQKEAVDHVAGSVLTQTQQPVVIEQRPLVVKMITSEPESPTSLCAPWPVATIAFIITAISLTCLPSLLACGVIIMYVVALGVAFCVYATRILN